MTPAPLRVAVLGSTGSIGRQAIEVAERHPDKVRIVALAANRSTEMLVEQAHRLGVRALAMACEDAAPRDADLPSGAVCRTGAGAVTDLARGDDVDVVLNALVGAVGLRVSEAALRAGKRLALANKESLVVGGDLLMPLAAPGQLLPVDSEHSAIFQCLWGEPADRVGAPVAHRIGRSVPGRDRASLASRHRGGGARSPRVDDGPEDHHRLGHAHEQGPRDDRGAPSLRDARTTASRSSCTRSRRSTRWSSSRTGP